jgi:hypothetical protein
MRTKILHDPPRSGSAPSANLQNWPWFQTMVLHFLIQGRVQGIGFRWYVHREASELDLRGWAKRHGRFSCLAVFRARHP